MSEKKEQKGIGDVNGQTVGSAARFNAGKTRYELLPTHLLKNTADVLAFGAEKYSPWNWARGFPLSTIIGCIKRHIAAIERGEDIDPESGLPHMGHIGCNLVFFEHVMNLIKNGHPELDDRPTKWFSPKVEEPVFIPSFWAGPIGPIPSLDDLKKQVTITTTNGLCPTPPPIDDPQPRHRISEMDSGDEWNDVRPTAPRC